MAKRGNGKKRDEFDKNIMRNWIICGVSLAAIIVLYFIGK